MHALNSRFYVVCPVADVSMHMDRLLLIADRLNARVSLYPKRVLQPCTAVVKTMVIVTEAPPCQEYVIEVAKLLRTFGGAWPFHHQEVMAAHSAAVALERIRCKK